MSYERAVWHSQRNVAQKTNQAKYEPGKIQNDLMAVLWRKQVDNKSYEVRNAGQTLRLYTDGVLHSEYNPNRAVTGSVWDLLFLPAFFYPPGCVRNVLVLGVGGGTVIQYMLKYIRPQRITGVDLDRVHLHVAKRYFGLDDDRNVDLHAADARRWLREYRGEKFDLIVEDLFAERGREPVRAVPADRSWLSDLRSRLAPSGCLVMNFINGRHLRQSAICRSGMERSFADRYVLSTPSTENRVAVLFRAPTDRALLRPRLRQTKILHDSLQQGRLRYTLRALDC